MHVLEGGHIAEVNMSGDPPGTSPSRRPGSTLWGLRVIVAQLFARLTEVSWAEKLGLVPKLITVMPPSLSKSVALISPEGRSPMAAALLVLSAGALSASIAAPPRTFEQDVRGLLGPLESHATSGTRQPYWL